MTLKLNDLVQCYRSVCDNVHLRSPDANFTVIDGKTGSNCNTIIMVGIPQHIRYIAFELFKNALRATVERYDEDTDLPEIEVLIVKTDGSDVAISVKDKGVGIRSVFH